jgi:hypothetical protein
MMKMTLTALLLVLAGSALAACQSSRPASVSESQIRANVPDDADFDRCLCGGGATRRVSSAGAMQPEEIHDFCAVMAQPEKLQGRVFKLQASARVFDGGILLESSRCEVQPVTTHYMEGYEKKSNALALEAIWRQERTEHEEARRGAGTKAERVVFSVVFEGKLEKNPYYHLQIDRGDQTLAAWDYAYPFAFVVSKIISARRVK